MYERRKGKEDTKATKHTLKNISAKNSVKDYSTLVSKCCVEQSFEATGVPLRRFRADFFENCGFKDKFKKYLLQKQFPNACAERKSYIKCLLDQLDNLQPICDFLAGTILGVPGSGKTTLLKKLKKELPEVLLVYPKTNLVSTYNSFQNSHLLSKVLAVGTTISADTILVDEFTLCESAEILLLQRKVGAKRIFLFGDRSQGNSDCLSSPEWLQVPCIFEKNRSLRFGPATSNLLSDVGLNVVGSKIIEDKVEVLPYEGESEETDTYLCLSRRTQDDLAELGIDCDLVDSQQGSEFNSVTLFVADWDKGLKLEEVLVGLTRHKKKLIVRTDVDLSKVVAPKVRTHKYA